MPASIQDQFVTYDRVRSQSAPYVNERIDLYTRARIQNALEQGRDAVIQRLVELDREWDIDRALMLNFAVVGGSTFAAGVLGRRGWLYFFGSQLAFLGLHAIQGWCPPAVLFRRLGFRTRIEIEAEKQALLQSLEQLPEARASAPRGRLPKGARMRSDQTKLTDEAEERA